MKLNSALIAILLFCTSLRAQTQQPTSPPPTLDDTLEAGDEELATPTRDLVNWNHFDLKFTTFRIGAGFLYEYSTYDQDAESKEQFAMDTQWRVRDARFVFKGQLNTDRPISWSLGLMYDPPTQKFLYRETGVMIGVPEIWGNIFIGRTKEGFSLNKIMVGYAGWTMERTPISDAMIPILADGVKWMAYLPEKHVFWNLGVFTDWISEGQSFSTYSFQTVGRVAWVPIMSEKTETVLHFGFNYRYGKPDDGVLRLRSRPESFEAPFFIDTGQFPATNTQTTDFEFYYRPRSLLIGSEYFLQKVKSPQTNNPFFNGGNVVVSWLPTGEVRPYNTRNAFFDQISPNRPVFQSGPGAWELVGNFSYANLDGGTVKGGVFWRFTPMVNWHMSDNVRLEFAYGYGSLDRFNLVGKTSFFQTRIQLQF